MRSVLALIAISCLLGFAVGADVAAEVETGAVASLDTEFAAQVQSAIAEQDTAEVASDEEDSDEAEDEAEDEDEASDESEDEVDDEFESEAEAEEDAEIDAELSALDAVDAAIEAAEVNTIESDESVDELEGELSEVESEINSLSDQVDAEDVRMAQGFWGSVAKGALNGAAKAAGKELGKALEKAAEKAVKVVSKVSNKIKNSSLGKAAKNLVEKGKKLVEKGKKLAKKAIKTGKKIFNKMKHMAHKKKDKKHKHKKVDKKKNHKKDKKKKKHHKHKKHHKKHHKKKHHKKCKKGKEGKKCRKERCKKHHLGCRYKCNNGKWSRRHKHKHNACRNKGGVMEPQPHDEMTDELERRLDIDQEIINSDGSPGKWWDRNPHPPKLGGPTTIHWFGGPKPKPKRGKRIIKHPVKIIGTKPPRTLSREQNEDPASMWNGVDPRYKGKPDLPAVPRLPEDVEDCVACQYVWKQVEQDVGNSAITQTIYDSFHANAVDAQKMPVFYPGCQTMFDAADDMISDYMDGYTVNQICENSMLCRPRDLTQFLHYQRVNKGV